MAQKQSSPEIRCAAFSAAREKRALSVEQLALLACLSKKQIQQIENGQSNSFYSPAIKLVAAKKVAKKAPAKKSATKKPAAGKSVTK